MLVRIHPFRFVTFRPLSLSLALLSGVAYGFAQTPADSSRTHQLDEVEINAKTQTETPTMSLFLPTKLQKKHSSNGLQLLDLLQIPQLEVSLLDNTLSLKGGGQLAITIDGREATMDEVRTLRAARIRRVEYTRTPTGKFVGKAGLLNLVTDIAEGGGNVYLSAEQGFTYKKGDYLAFADYTSGKSYFSAFLYQDWQRNHDYSEGTEAFHFTDGSHLSRVIANKGNLYSANSWGGRLRYTYTTELSSFNTYANFVRSATPHNDQASVATYAGKHVGTAGKSQQGSGRGCSPSLHVDYSRSLPRAQNLDFYLDASLGRDARSMLYHEDGQDDLWSDASERNYVVSGKAIYSKNWDGGWMGQAQLSHEWKHYDDDYRGTTPSNQLLTTHTSIATLGLMRQTERFYGYLYAGMSGLWASLNGMHQRYLHPQLYYGGNYAFSDKRSLSLNGIFVNTWFTPSNKNAATVPTSFFESVIGNPELKPIKILTNTLSFTTSLGRTKLSGTYMSLLYFDNELDRFTLDAARIYRMRINHDLFSGNLFTVEASQNFFNNHLQLTASVQQELNYLRGDDYHLSKSILRYSGSATYLVGDFRFAARFTSGYHALDIREPFFVHYDPRYSLSAQWSHGAWSLTFAAQNVFKRYFEQHLYMDYGRYQREGVRAFETQGRCLNLTISYNFGFGRKQQAGEREVDKNINSAILK